MKKNISILIVLIVLATFPACKKGGAGGAPEIEPSITPVGTSDGTAVTKAIGSAGGTILSDDGEVELIIPPGALPGNTDITIQPITNNIPTGNGKAYRFTPDGLQFAKDITIKFHYTEEEAARTQPEYMQVAFQNADGSWKLVDKITNDVNANIISASVNHFTDFSQFDVLRLLPSIHYLKPGQTKQFDIEYGGVTADNMIAFGLAMIDQNASWKVNGIAGGNSTYGTIQPVGIIKGKYTAPTTAPPMNPVTISAEIDIPFVVDGQRFLKGIINGQAFITGNNYGVVIEHEYTFSIGTGEKFVMKDKVSFSLHLLGGIQGTVDNLENSVPTVQKIAESPANCFTEFIQLGTGTLHVTSVDKIGVTVNPIDNEVYIGDNGLTEFVLPIIRTTCSGVAPGTNELPIAFIGMPSFEFDDSSQTQVVDQSVQDHKLIIRITPLP